MRPLTLSVTILVAAALGATGYFQAAHLNTATHAVEALTGGNPRRGREQVRELGCVACHDIPTFTGVRTAVGPPLTGFGGRMYIAGVLENKPDNLIRFLQHPREVLPRGAMPELHLTDADARDLAAFLYTLQ